MKFENLMNAVRTAQQSKLDATDLFILNEVYCADNNMITIMKIVTAPAAPVSGATLHARLKKLCVNGFLVKKEDAKNMRLKTVEPGEAFKEFLRKLGEVE